MNYSDRTEWKINESTFIYDVQAVSMPDLPDSSLLSCRFAPAHYHDSLFLRHGLPLPATLAQSVVKRRAEYLAGRYLCKKMLDVHGLPSIVPSGASREPIWPAGWLGSITHTRDMAISCLCRDSDIALLGIDLEAWMDDSLASNIADTIIDQHERQLLAGPWRFSQGLSLVFSAKESFFKAAFPLVKRYFDFDGVRMVDIDYAAKRFSLRVAEPLAPELPRGRILTGSFQYDEKSVFTVLAQRPSLS